MISGVLRTIFGDMNKHEVRKFSILSVTFLLLIGSYWLLRVLKDALFDDLVGLAYQPKAKMLSLVIILPLLLFYTKLVDTVERHKLFYIICSFYAVFFAAIAYFYVNPLPVFFPELAAKIPGKLLGWVTYVGVESFGSLTIGLFWAFIASTTSTASAKRGYGIVYGVGQIGTIGGAILVSNATYFGLPLLVSMGAAAVFSVPLLIALLMKVVPKEEMQSEVKEVVKKKPTGLFEGLRLLTTTPYLLGVLVVSTVYEVVATVMDLQMKLLGRAAYTNKEAFASFLGKFAVTTNSLALIFAILGTSFFVRTFGVRFCLVMFPVTAGCVIASTLFFPSLWPVFVAVVVIKGLSYTLNNPVKEMMYIPTSKDVKFKAKSWIEAFGSRTAKATGSVINDSFAGSLPNLMFYGSLTSLGIVGAWACVAFLVGTTYTTLIRDNKIIE